ncbi:MAG TPA: acyl carrier protein [Phycisphaerae bacterium]|nr:acyl carrier protein [Phycisphaerae bacterium]
MESLNQKKFRSAVSAVLGMPAEEVRDELSPETIDTWDSLNHINLISALEQEFGVTLPTESLGGRLSVGGLRELLSRHGVAL